jgi:hypothetical protein
LLFNPPVTPTPDNFPFDGEFYIDKGASSMTGVSTTFVPVLTAMYSDLAIPNMANVV